MKHIAFSLIVASLISAAQLTTYAKPPPGNKPPGSKPPSGNKNDYFGGPKAWYQAGNSLGKKDRKAGRPPMPDRYKDQFDKITEAEFKRGYMDAYR